MMPCERFTVLEWRPDENIETCDVCDHVEVSHENPGRRRLSGGEIEALRRRMIEENFERQQAEGRQNDGDGANENALAHPPGTNSEPIATDS